MWLRPSLSRWRRSVISLFSVVVVVEDVLPVEICSTGASELISPLRGLISWPPIIAPDGMVPSAAAPAAPAAAAPPAAAPAAATPAAAPKATPPTTPIRFTAAPPIIAAFCFPDISRNGVLELSPEDSPSVNCIFCKEDSLVYRL